MLEAYFAQLVRPAWSVTFEIVTAVAALPCLSENPSPLSDLSSRHVRVVSSTSLMWLSETSMPHQRSAAMSFSDDRIADALQSFHSVLQVRQSFHTSILILGFDRTTNQLTGPPSHLKACLLLPVQLPLQPPNSSIPHSFQHA